MTARYVLGLVLVLTVVAGPVAGLTVPSAAGGAPDGDGPVHATLGAQYDQSGKAMFIVAGIIIVLAVLVSI